MTTPPLFRSILSWPRTSYVKPINARSNLQPHAGSLIKCKEFSAGRDENIVIKYLKLTTRFDNL